LLATGTNHTNPPVIKIMPNIHTLDCFDLAYNSLQQWKKIISNDILLPADIIEQIEDIIIPALEYIDGWEPSDDEMMSSFGTKWHDGL
jgi:hypothetical protein